MQQSMITWDWFFNSWKGVPVFKCGYLLWLATDFFLRLHVFRTYTNVPKSVNFFYFYRYNLSQYSINWISENSKIRYPPSNFWVHKIDNYLPNKLWKKAIGLLQRKLSKFLEKNIIVTQKSVFWTKHQKSEEYGKYNGTTVFTAKFRNFLLLSESHLSIFSELYQRIRNPLREAVLTRWPGAHTHAHARGSAS